MEINGIKLITDRSNSDVEIAKALIKKGFQNITDEEKRLFLSGLKGAYNYTDFNRVESCVEYLVQKLYNTATGIEDYAKKLGVYLEPILSAEYDKNKYANGLETKTNWSVNDFANKEDRQRYINNILFIIDGFQDLSTLPKVMDGMTYSSANNIEKALGNLDMYLTNLKNTKENLITNTANAWFFSGDLYGGEI
jgi:hypothetical protein